MKDYQYLFGPVPSRRLGRSLGVDLVPFKTCNFDCIFCQLGRTTDKTTARKEYVPVDAVIEELEAWVKSGGHADYITLSGSGEPTLHSRFGRIIECAHQITRIPVAVLTNGSLLGEPEVRKQAATADVVKASLSAWDQSSLEHINRPCSGIEFKQLLEGQRLFRNCFQGELWMEVFLVWGTNTTAKDIARIAELVKEIGPDRVQLNTAVRPSCEEYAFAVPQKLMETMAGFFDPRAEVIAEYSTDLAARTRAGEKEILGMLQRRPCTLDQVCEAFNLHRNEGVKYLGKLTRTGKVRENRKDNEIYYFDDREKDRPHANL